MKNIVRWNKVKLLLIVMGIVIISMICFKIYIRDTGLLVSMLEEGAQKAILDDDLYINKLGYTKQVPFKNKILVKDKNGNNLIVDINDPLYISGELIPFWTDHHHTEKTKQKLHETFLKIHH